MQQGGYQQELRFPGDDETSEGLAELSEGASSFDRLAAQIPFFSTLIEQPLSTRLSGVLVKDYALHGDVPTFSDYLYDMGGFRGHFFKLPNFGRKSASELYSTVVRILSEREAAESRLASGGPSIEVPTPASEPSPEEALASLMQGLSEREVDVLHRRYGLQGGAAETLEQVAIDYGLTRERVRQIAKKAILRLGHGVLGDTVRRAFKQHASLVWDRASTSSGVILLGDEVEAANRLSGEQLLAVEIAYGTFGEWLEVAAHKTDLAWFQDELTCSKFTAAQQQVAQKASEQYLPYPLEVMTVGADTTFGHAIAASLGMKLYLAFRRTTHTAALEQALPSTGVTMTASAVLVDGRDYFVSFRE